MEGNQKELFYHKVGAEVEICFNGEWIRGKVVEGYRFRDGVITIETPEGKRIWCPEGKPELYRNVEI